MQSALDSVLNEPKFYLPPRAIPKKISNLKNTFKNKKIVEPQKVFEPL